MRASSGQRDSLCFCRVFFSFGFFLAGTEGIRTHTHWRIKKIRKIELRQQEELVNHRGRSRATLLNLVGSGFNGTELFLFLSHFLFLAASWHGWRELKRFSILIFFARASCVSTTTLTKAWSPRAAPTPRSDCGAPPIAPKPGWRSADTSWLIHSLSMSFFEFVGIDFIRWFWFRVFFLRVLFFITLFFFISCQQLLKCQLTAFTTAAFATTFNRTSLPKIINQSFP